MGHSSAWASSCAVLALLGGLFLAETANAQAGGSVGAGGSVSTAPAPAAPAARGPCARRGSRSRRDCRTPPPDALRRRRRGRRGAWPPSGPRAIARSTSRTRITGGIGSPPHPARAERARPASSGSASSPSGSRRASSAPPSSRARTPTGGAALTTDTLSHTGGTLSLGRLAGQHRSRHVRRLRRRQRRTPTATRRTGPSLLQVLGRHRPRHQVHGARRRRACTSGSSRSSGSSTAPARWASTAAARAPSSAASPRPTCAARDVVVDVPLRFSAERRLLARQHRRRLAAHRGGARRAGHAHRALRPRRQPGRPLRLPARRRGLHRRRARAALHRGAHPGSPTTARTTPATSTTRARDNCLANDTVVPSTLTLGSRFFPWKRGFSLLAAFDIGLGGTHDFIEELQPVPPWTLYLGAGWAVDTQDRPPVVKTGASSIVEKSTPRGHVIGFVHEKDKNDPIVGRDRDLPRPPGPLGRSPRVPTASSATRSRPAPTPTTSRPTATRPAPATRTSPRPAPRCAIDCPLEALPRVGMVVGHVRDADTSQPLAGIQVVMTDAQHKDLTLNTDASGGFRFEGVAPGTAQLSVEADGYLVLVVPADVQARQETAVDLALRPKPKQPKVVGHGEGDHHQGADPVRARQRGDPAGILRDSRRRSPTRSSATPRSSGSRSRATPTTAARPSTTSS